MVGLASSEGWTGLDVHDGFPALWVPGLEWLEGLGAGWCHSLSVWPLHMVRASSQCGGSNRQKAGAADLLRLRPDTGTVSLWLCPVVREVTEPARLQGRGQAFTSRWEERQPPFTRACRVPESFKGLSPLSVSRYPRRQVPVYPLTDEG